MTPDHHVPQAPRHVNRNRRAVEEDNAWARLYRDIDQPSTAEEVVKYLKANPEAMKSQMPLYVLALGTIRRDKLATERKKFLARLLRQIVIQCVIVPAVATWNALRWLFSSGADVAMEAFPSTAVSPAVARVNALKNDPDIAPAIEGLIPKDDSRRSKAA